MATWVTLFRHLARLATEKEGKKIVFNYNLVYTQFKIFTHLIKELRRNTVQDSELKGRSLYSRVSAWAPIITNLALVCHLLFNGGEKRS
jgi:hypothetical protein